MKCHSRHPVKPRVTPCRGGAGLLPVSETTVLLPCDLLGICVSWLMQTNKGVRKALAADEVDPWNNFGDMWFPLMILKTFKSNSSGFFRRNAWALKVQYARIWAVNFFIKCIKMIYRKFWHCEVNCVAQIATEASFPVFSTPCLDHQLHS